MGKGDHKTIMVRSEALKELTDIQEILLNKEEYYGSFNTFLDKKYDLREPVKPVPKALSNDSSLSDPKWQNPPYSKLLSLKEWNIRVFGKWRNTVVTVFFLFGIFIAIVKIPSSSSLSMLLSIFAFILSLAVICAIFSYVLSLITMKVPDPSKIREEQDKLYFNNNKYAKLLDKYYAEKKTFDSRSDLHKLEYEQQKSSAESKIDAFRKKYSFDYKNMNSGYIEKLISLMQENEGITNIEAAKEILNNYLKR